MGGTVYALAGGKGGVGKTTTAVNLGVALQQAGHDTVVVDADLAMADLGCRLELDCAPGIHGVLAGEQEIRESIVRGPAGLTVLSGTRDLDGFAAADPGRLPKTLELLSVAYDVVLVDTGSGIQRESMIAQRAADGTILVTSPRDIAIRDTEKTGELAQQADCPVVGVVVTRAEDERGVAEIAERLDTDLLAAIPRHPVAEGDPRMVTHPDSAAATAYQRLATVLPVSDTEPPTDDPDEEPADAERDTAETADDDAATDEAVTEGETEETTAATGRGSTDAAATGAAATDGAVTDGGVPHDSSADGDGGVPHESGAGTVEN